MNSVKTGDRTRAYPYMYQTTGKLRLKRNQLFCAALRKNRAWSQCPCIDGGVFCTWQRLCVRSLRVRLERRYTSCRRWYCVAVRHVCLFLCILLRALTRDFQVDPWVELSSCGCAPVSFVSRIFKSRCESPVPCFAQHNRVRKNTPFLKWTLKIENAN